MHLLIFAILIEIERKKWVDRRKRIYISFSKLFFLFNDLFFQDVSFKPQEFYVKTRKCEPDAGANVVKTCERQVIVFDLIFSGFRIFLNLYMNIINKEIDWFLVSVL